MPMKPLCAMGLIVSLLAAGCATPGSDPQCADDSSAIGFIIPSGFGISIGESGAKAAFKTIRDYFSARPAATSAADKAKAAELAAEAAAKSAPPMNDEQKRALRSQAGEWVETYTEKCKPRS